MITRTEHGEMEFRFHHPNAESVHLVGDFNHWEEYATPMSRTPDGDWVVSLVLQDGIYEYKFLVDGKYQLDAAAANVEEVPFGCNTVLVLNQSAVPAQPVG